MSFLFFKKNISKLNLYHTGFQYVLNAKTI